MAEVGASKPATLEATPEAADAEKAFGEVALEKKAVTEDGLKRAARAREELARFGVEKRLEDILIALGVLDAAGVKKVERAVARRSRIHAARRFGRVLVKNKLATEAAVKDGLAALKSGGWKKTLGEVLVAKGVMKARAVAVVEKSIAEKARDRGKKPATMRIERTDLDAAAAALRREDTALAAVALREGLVELAELDRSLVVCRESGRRPPPTLAQVLVERGILTERMVAALEATVAVGLRGQLRVPAHTVLDLLGHGSTGLVVRARHDLLGREVAIKIVRCGSEAEAVDLLEEVRRTARVRHPNVVFLHDVGRLPQRLYLIMELLEGPTLMDEIRRRGPLPERDVLRWTRDLCRALEALETVGLVHRDLKPHNIVIEDDGARAKLTDLGLARPIGWRFDKKGVIAGTPHTISPEQARGEPVDIRSDLYSLGATTYYALVGAPPYHADSSLDIVLRHLDDPVPDPRALRAEVSADAAALVASLMAKIPEDRPDGPRLVAERLEALLAKS